VASLRGYDPLPAPQYLLDAAEAGNQAEVTVKGLMRDEGYVIMGEQDTMEWEPAPGIIVRGHFDASTCIKDNEDRMLEVKSMSERRFQAWLKYGWEKFPMYAWQLSAYMLDTGKKATYAIINRETNELLIEDVDELLVDEVTMRRKVLLVKYYVEQGTYPSCQGLSEYSCPYDYMCDKQGTLFEEVESGTEEMLVRLAQEYDVARQMEADVKAKKEAIRAEILTAMGKRKQVKVGDWSIVKSVQTGRTRFNKQKARLALGDDKLSEFYDDADDVTQLRVKETG
jgi:hypothetical protein